MLMLHNDITLVTRVSMFVNPKNLQISSPHGQPPINRLITVTGVLITATNRSAVVRPRINMLVMVLSSRFLLMIIHKVVFPRMAPKETTVNRHPSTMRSALGSSSSSFIVSALIEAFISGKVVSEPQKKSCCQIFEDSMGQQEGCCCLSVLLPCTVSVAWWNLCDKVVTSEKASTKMNLCHESAEKGKQSIGEDLATLGAQDPWGQTEKSCHKGPRC